MPNLCTKLMICVIVCLNLWTSANAQDKFDIWLSCRPEDKFGDFETVNARTAWYWFQRKDGNYDRSNIHFPTVRANNQKKPIQNGRPIVLDIEPKGMPRGKLLRQTAEAIRYYRCEYPNNKIILYRTVPLLRFWGYAQWDAVSNNLNHPEYQSRKEYFNHIQDDNSSDASLAITRQLGIVTCRAYLPYDNANGIANFWRSMRPYHQEAHQYGDLVYTYLRPAFLNSRKPISGELMTQLLETAREEWKSDGVIIFYLPEDEADEWKEAVIEFDVKVNKPAIQPKSVLEQKKGCN